MFLRAIVPFLLLSCAPLVDKENTALDPRDPPFMEAASQVRYSAFRTFTFPNPATGETEYGLLIESRGAPFACGESPFGSESAFSLFLRSPQPFEAGYTDLAREFRGQLVSEGTRLFSAEPIPGEGQFEGVVTLHALSEDSLTAKAEVLVLADGFTASYEGEPIEDLLLFFDIKNAPNCTPFLE